MILGKHDIREGVQKPKNVRPPSTIKRKAKKMAAVQRMGRMQLELEIETEDARSAASQEELASVRSEIYVLSSDSMMSALTRSEISASDSMMSAQTSDSMAGAGVGSRRNKFVLVNHLEII
eukprot:SAG11_NODE_3015_length_2761_cov_12.682945_3_plen_121_part_00